MYFWVVMMKWYIFVWEHELMSNCKASSVHFDTCVCVCVCVYTHIEMPEGIWYQSNIIHVSSYETQNIINHPKMVHNTKHWYLI